MPHAIRFHKTGGPEVLQWEEVAVGDPGPNEARIRLKAVGLNYIDTYHRSGLYPLPLPSAIGREGAGIVEAVGPGVADIKAGDRAACMMLQGLTVHYLLRRTYPVKAGETILFHAAAGGVGLIACQWAKALGVNLIGTVGSEEKAAIAREHGAAHTTIHTNEDFLARVKELTGGKGVPVVYDSIGKDTFMKSLDCLQPRGVMVSFGNATGPVDAFNLGVLAQKGSLYVTRPTLDTHVGKREELLAATAELFDHVVAGRIKINPRQSYALKDAAQAHRDLEARKTTGSTILVP